MSSIRQQNTRTANTCRFIFDGEVVAEGTSIQATENSNAQPVQTLNTPYAQEHVHSTYGVQGSIASLHWKKRGLEKLGAGQGELVQIPEFDIQGIDESDNKILFVCRRVTITSRGFSISANQPVQRNLSFNAIRLDDGRPSSAGAGGAASTNQASASAV
jgi:hypothetical protein